MNIKSFPPFVMIIAIIMCGIVACSNTPPEKITKKESSTIAWNSPDDKAVSILGNRLSKLLLNPKKVEMYSVIYQDSAHLNNEIVEPEFVIDSLIARLSKEQIATLNFILVGDTANYSLDKSIIPMVPHRPKYAFKFKTKKEEAILWYCPDDFTWGIRYDGRNIVKYNVHSPYLITRFCNRISRQ
ncbi:MAG: hypothetical protein HFJ95_04145 [Muribaculaceae bacterium]|nr:hypothetical protein [Muribaculaceae bacterium]